MPTRNSGGIVLAPQAVNPIFDSLKIGGGGYVTGIQIANDGYMCCRVDVFGAYIGNVAIGTVWQPALTSDNAPGKGTLWGFSNGITGGTFKSDSADIYEVQMCPTNSSVIYAMWMGLMVVSQDRGSTWTVMSNFPAIDYQADSNIGGNDTRTRQKKMAVDPNNANFVVIATPNNGVYYTQNGLLGAAATFTQIASIPTPTGVTNPAGGTYGRNGYCGISFDTTSGTTGGFTNNVAVFSNGNGVYISTNSASSFSLSTGSPTAITDGFFANGNYYAATSTAAFMLQAGTWSNISGGFVSCLAIDPTDSTHIAGMGNGGGNFNQGIISGTTGTWTGPYFSTGANPSPPSDVGWFANVAIEFTPYFWAAGGCAFDPIVSQRFWLSYGYGVSYLDIPSKTAPQNTNMGFTTQHKGIEDLVAVRAVSIPNFQFPILAVYDQQVFQIVNPETPPSASVPQLGARNRNNACWSLEYSQSHSGVVAALSSGGYVGVGSYSGVSTDGGNSWTQFTTAPFATDGGMITCTDSTHFVAVTSEIATSPVFSADGGTTWNTCTGPPTGFYQQSRFNNAQTLCNDAAGTIFLYLFAATAGTAGLYSSTDNGATFNLVNSDTTVCVNNFQANLKALPGSAGNLFITTGYNGFANPTYPTGQGFYRSTNGGVNWTAISNVQDVWMFGFGQKYPGFANPTLWVWGFVKTSGAPPRWGIWRSRDLGASDWTYITEWGGGLNIFPRSLDGDMNDFTKIYMGYSGNSYRYGRNIN